MNAAQAGAVQRLLVQAEHPATDPMTGREYPADELEDLRPAGKPDVAIKGYDRERPGQPEMMEVGLSVAGSLWDVELFVDPDGGLWSWSTVRVPAEDCECECGRPGPFRDSPPVSREQCPRHGQSVRELECFRRVTFAGWTVDAEASFPRWRFVVREGDPIRDVLGEYRAERAAAKAAA